MGRINAGMVTVPSEQAAYEHSAAPSRQSRAVGLCLLAVFPASAGRHLDSIDMAGVVVSWADRLRKPTKTSQPKKSSLPASLINPN